MPRATPPRHDSEASDTAILDIALTLFADLGIKRVSPDDIARRAGINRATLYRKFGTKQDIVRAAVIHEVSQERERIVTAVERIDDPMERITYGFALTVITLRSNTILNKALEFDAAQTLESLTTGAAGLMDIAVAFTREWLVKAVPGLPDVDGAAGLIVRLMHSLVLTPGGAPNLSTESELREYTRDWICPLVSRNGAQKPQ